MALVFSKQLDDWTTRTERVADPVGPGNPQGVPATVLKADHHLQERHVGGFWHLMVNNTDCNCNAKSNIYMVINNHI